MYFVNACIFNFIFQMNLEPGQEVFEVMIAANKVGLVIGTTVQDRKIINIYNY